MLQEYMTVLTPLLTAALNFNFCTLSIIAKMRRLPLRTSVVLHHYSSPSYFP